VGSTKTLSDLQEAWRTRRAERRRRQQLRRDLLEFRTPAERHELDAILARYDTTVSDLLAGRQPAVTVPEPLPDRGWEEIWDEIVLELTADDEPRDDR
jgi:hypothetical protein